MSESRLKSFLAGRKVAVLYLNFGPYHVARLRAIAQALQPHDARLVGVELAGSEKHYPWRVQRRHEAFEWRTLFEDAAVELIASRDQAQGVRAMLDEVQPAAVVIPGWSHAFHRAAAAWCRSRRGRVVAVVSADTTAARPQGRTWLFELYKRWLLRGFDAAHVSGHATRDYLASLGFPRERVFFKYDAVDNDFFWNLAEDTRRRCEEYRQRFAVPQRFFFLPSRTLERKNHLRLVTAYERYLARCEGPPWGLVMVGSGPMDALLDQQIARLSATPISRRPFAQIEDIARYYGLASALIFPSWSETWGLILNEAAAAGLPILSSNRAPAATHLASDGVNGWRFDPFNVEDMAAAMKRMASLSDDVRARMGAESRRIVADWGLEQHAAELLRAIELGFTQPCR